MDPESPYERAGTVYREPVQTGWYFSTKKLVLRTWHQPYPPPPSPLALLPPSPTLWYQSVPIQYQPFALGSNQRTGNRVRSA
eukprot:1077492-Rhodomonas_salina.2